MNTFWQTAVEVDRRLCAKQFPYCIIKSYGGDPEYLDGNIDVVVTAPLKTVYQAAFCEDFEISSRDKVKNWLYERNKLMLSPSNKQFCKIHLHSNVGWHNFCFIEGKNIIENSKEIRLEDEPVRVLDRDWEARVFLLHIIFEQFKKSPRDTRFLHWDDCLSFASEFEIDLSALKNVFEAKGNIEIENLRPIWTQYYRARKGDVGLWHRFLHELLVRIQSNRRRKGNLLKATKA